MKICVINLDEAADRWAFFEDQAARLGLTINRISAVDGSKISDEDLLRSCAPRRTGNRCTRFELAVYRSHTLAWREILESGEPFGVVFEDDVFLADDSATFVSDPLWLPSDSDIVKLNATNLLMTLSADSTPISNGRELRRVFRRSQDAGGYIISRKYAQALLAEGEPIIEAVDLFLFDPKKVGRVHQVNPGLCIQASRADFVFLAPDARESRVQVHRPRLSGARDVRGGLSRLRPKVARHWFRAIKEALLARHARVIRATVPFG
jgi:glycosyl transferase, family 25